MVFGHRLSTLNLMEYYLAVNGGKVGPLTQLRLVEMLRDGEASRDDKVWHKGMDSWRPITEVPSLKAALESVGRARNAIPPGENPVATSQTPSKKVFVATEVRPLTRFWARYFDYTIVAVLVVMFSDFEMPKIEPGLTFADLVTRYEEIFKSDQMRILAQIQFYALLAWHVIEGILIGIFGTTPGKALFGIHVLSAKGGKPPIVRGICRSFLVYILGVGLFCFSLLTLVLMTMTFLRLMTRGFTFWDQMLDLRVKHPPLSFARVLLAILAFIILMTLQSVKFS
jgi:uncharacterized RDD family membrane protein YckC